MHRYAITLFAASFLSSCTVDGSGTTMGEATGRVARKGARETKRFFSGIAKGWKDEAQAPPLSPPPPSPSGPYAYPQAGGYR